MRLGHPEAPDRLNLEVKFNQHGGLVSHNPAVMLRLDGDGLRSGELLGAAVGVPNLNLASNEESYVCVHTEVSADDRFQVSRPAESGRVNYTFHPAGASSNDFDLNPADFAAFSSLDGCEEWIGCTHIDVLWTKR